MIGLTLIKTTLDEKLPQTGGITQTFNDLNVNSAHFSPPLRAAVCSYSLILLYDTTVVLIKKKKNHSTSKLFTYLPGTYAERS